MKPDFADGLAIKMWLLMIQAVEKLEAELQDSEREYIKSFRAKLEEGRPLSKKQAQVLKDIHGRRLDALRKAAERLSAGG